MAKQNFKKQDENLENVQEALSTTGQWIEDNSNLLTWIVCGIVAVVLGVVALNTYVFKPKAIEASNENAKAAVYFAQNNWEKALQGDDAECAGFEATAADYKFYQQGKLAALYAGICYYKMEDYENAAKYLKKFSSKDLNVDPAANQLLGDAYVQLKEYKHAVIAFENAAKSGNEMIAPMSLKKAGIVYLELDNKRAALKSFEAVKALYPASAEAQDIDKYIALTK